MIGYIVLLFHIILLSIVGYKSKPKENTSIKTHIFCGREIPVWLLTTSIFSAWMWVTTIIGSAEAWTLYGISGAIAYVTGACFAFLFFIFLLIALLKKSNRAFTYVEFMGQRYSESVKNMYYVIAILVSAYVLIEQASGVAFVLKELYGSSYKQVSFLIVIIGVVYVIYTGMKGIIFNEFLSAIIIILGFSIFYFFLFKSVNFEELKINILEIQTNPNLEWYNPNVLNLIYSSGVRFFIISILVFFGQLIFDPTFYLKANLLKNYTDVKKSFFIGGVILWIPIALTSAFSLGLLYLCQSVGVEPYNGSSRLEIIFGILIITMGGSAIHHYLMGIMNIFTLEYYKEKIKPNPLEKEQLAFGKLVTVLFGCFCALITISLEDISLLKIDMFCGVFFAAPCGGIIFGVYSKKIKGNAPIYATLVGFVFGFYIWTSRVVPSDWSWFLGTLTSFLCPMIFLGVVGMIFEKIEKI